MDSGRRQSGCSRSELAGVYVDVENLLGMDQAQRLAERVLDDRPTERCGRHLGQRLNEISKNSKC